MAVLFLGDEAPFDLLVDRLERMTLLESSGAITFSLVTLRGGPAGPGAQSPAVSVRPRLSRSGSDAAASKPQGQPGTDMAAEADGAGPSTGPQGTGAQAGDAKLNSGSGAGKGKFCRTNELTAGAVDSSPDWKVGEVTVRMTNKGTRTCSVTGFSDDDLKDIDGTSAPVHRGGEQPRITDLKPDDTATFSISYVVDFSGDSPASLASIIVTPPDETHSVSLRWPADALKLAGPYDEKIRVHPVGIANRPPRREDPLASAPTNSPFRSGFLRELEALAMDHRPDRSRDGRLRPPSTSEVREEKWKTVPQFARLPEPLARTEPFRPGPAPNMSSPTTRGSPTQGPAIQGLVISKRLRAGAPPQRRAGPQPLLKPRDAPDQSFSYGDRTGKYAPRKARRTRSCSSAGTSASADSPMQKTLWLRVASMRLRREWWV